MTGGPPQPKRAHYAQPLHPKLPIDPSSIPASIMPIPPSLNGRAGHHPHVLPHGQPMSRSNIRKQVISWMDAPDDVYFRATNQTK